MIKKAHKVGSVNKLFPRLMAPRGQNSNFLVAIQVGLRFFQLRKLYRRSVVGQCYLISTTF